MSKRINVIEKTIKKRRGIQKTEGLLASSTGIPSSDQSSRGMEAEEKAYNAAMYWRRKKIIRDVRKTEGLSVEDINKKDLIVTLLSGEEIPVQVKNYYNFFLVQRFRNKFRNGEILLFHIWPDEGEDVAKERMLELIVSAHLKVVGHLQLRRILRELGREEQPLKQSFVRRFATKIRGVFS